MNRPAEPILHVDLDAFYASVEVVKDPSLAGRPVIVGGTGPRGVVASASYEARRFGVRSAMPTVRARRLCPDGVFLPPDPETYRAYANRFREILQQVTPSVEPIALDEAFLDVGGATRLFGPPTAVAAAIRSRVLQELGLTCSVGVAATKLVAKLASEACKPDGLLLVPVDRTRAFLGPLPVRRLWGVGEGTAELLTRLGIRTVADLARTPIPILERLLGEAQARQLATLSQGIDDRPVVPFEPPRSIGHEQTFERDVDDADEIARELLHLSHRVAARLRSEGYRARTVTLKARLPTFVTLTRSRTLTTPTDVGSELYAVVRELAASLPGARRRYRLLGVQAGGLQPAGAEQLALLRGRRWAELERAVDRVQRRFGEGLAQPATLLERPRDP